MSSTTTNVKQKPGIFWVNSDVLPHKVSSLSRSDFDFWYLDDHIPDVISRSGVAGAARWNYIPTRGTPERELKYLTTYDFPDLAFMKTPEFMSLEGVVPGPNRWTIFENVEFDSREYELVQIDEKVVRKDADHPTLLLYASIVHTKPKELDDWYRGEHVRLISQCPNYRRTRRFRLVQRSLLSSFERTRFEDEPETYMALHEFDGEELPWKKLQATDETEWGKRVLKGVKSVDWGAFGLSKAWRKNGGVVEVVEGKEKEKARL